jgi:gamma-glutamyltranspeptidase/glutathione hydrolase
MRPGRGLDPVRVESADGVEQAWGKPSQGDTSKLDVVDRAGNAIPVTMSGGWLMSSPVIPGLGFPRGTRGQMFSLIPGHPNCVGPGRRPRTTLTPTLAEGDAGKVICFGSPGGDCQDQWALQFFLNVVHFGMDLQQAVEAPTFFTRHWPDSFYPRKAEPASLYLEPRIGEPVRAELLRRGHLAQFVDEWSAGNTCAVMRDQRTGLLGGGASPRMEPAAAVGY